MWVNKKNFPEGRGLLSCNVAQGFPVPGTSYNRVTLCMLLCMKLYQSISFTSSCVFLRKCFSKMWSYVRSKHCIINIIFFNYKYNVFFLLFYPIMFQCQCTKNRTHSFRWVWSFHLITNESKPERIDLSFERPAGGAARYCMQLFFMENNCPFYINSPYPYIHQRETRKNQFKSHTGYRLWFLIILAQFRF